MKVVYFNIENYEEEFFTKNSIGFDFYLEKESLNEINSIKKEYLDADIISVFTDSRLTKKVLDKFTDLKLIALRSVGYNHVDIDYCKNQNIKVVNSPNYGNITVAEFALALLLNVARKVTKSYLEFKTSCVNPAEFIGVELANKNIGIVGVGAIGSAFAKICSGLSMNILAYDKFPKDHLEKELNLKYVDFETLLKESDFISIHAPFTKENYHMFDESAFKLMKNNAILINTGRGELIDSMALYNALVEHKIAGAGLDVLEKEETLTDCDFMIGINRLNKFTLEQTVINSQLFKLDNVIITPHIAFNSKEAIRRILDTTIKNITEFSKGNLINSVIN